MTIPIVVTLIIEKAILGRLFLLRLGITKIWVYKASRMVIINKVNLNEIVFSKFPEKVNQESNLTPKSQDIHIPVTIKAANEDKPRGSNFFSKFKIT